MKTFKRINRNTFITWIIVILLWQTLALLSTPEFLPGPRDTILGARELIADGSLIKYILISLLRVIVGWSIGSLIGIPIGLLIGRLKIVRDILEPLINFFRFVPAIGFITLFILWFGVGEISKSILIIYATSFVVMLNTATGVLSIEEEKIRAARSLGASEFQILLHVIIPSSIPFIFNGVRLSMGNSFMAIVGAEMIAANEGVGYLIWTSRLYFKTTWIFVGLVTLGIMGYFSDKLLRTLGGKTLKKYGVVSKTQFGSR
ncbi:putative aliphatic sulfonates transport permease protein SsuC [Gottschalkia purinilytica]|uniref:Putative aliphatic sulfonates transport permease protein SsuC n=1 Tax=Gottschalkia purinilytica TaxID=1503 RepID=A0A0L0WDK0_GOTPU|nr:ABC transporter permease [Gottschalkia purinilytica]KNF09553.1 putative aliphatic sulfonates transport permease protein SsuC [Gottschalkia purinilytica]